MIGMVDTPREVWVSDQMEHVGEPNNAAEASTVGWIKLADVAQMIDRGKEAQMRLDTNAGAL